MLSARPSWRAASTTRRWDADPGRPAGRVAPTTARRDVAAALVDMLLASRPPKPGPEWWLLLDLAADADDETRQTMPGYSYMAARTQAPRSTIYRWLGSLHKQGLVRTVRHSTGGAEGTEGERAIYEILVSAHG